MKKNCPVISIIILFCMSLCACSDAQRTAAVNSNGAAPIDSDRGQTTLQIEGGAVSVEYGRPALKGRDLEKMIRPGQEWRMGSNAATTFTTDVDLVFGDKPVPKGKYILKAKLVEQEKWLLLFQSEGQEQAAEVPLTLQRVDSPAELMTIELVRKGSGGSFILHWGDLALSAD
ncbi:MAG TPA: DUF2911 domain-containing protein, partial [Blastocatellia bacterium]